MSSFFDIFRRNKKEEHPKTAEVRSALVHIVSNLDTTDGKSRVVKVGEKYFRVRELG
ncbi:MULTISPECIES: hypothetical protein [unclassified Flavobacterium]|uniref:hypothetical protein n=1 Tax=unclassified Flavobacterium TaxID=196869 RepID=UPI0036122C9F